MVLHMPYNFYDTSNMFKGLNFDLSGIIFFQYKGEDGFDRGGLLHEFMTLALHGISALPIFVGKNPESRYLSLDVTGM